MRESKTYDSTSITSIHRGHRGNTLWHRPLAPFQLSLGKCRSGGATASGVARKPRKPVGAQPRGWRHWAGQGMAATRRGNARSPPGKGTTISHGDLHGKNGRLPMDPEDIDDIHPKEKKQHSHNVYQVLWLHHSVSHWFDRHNEAVPPGQSEKKRRTFNLLQSSAIFN